MLRISRTSIALSDVDKVTVLYSEPTADGYARRKLIPVAMEKLKSARELIRDMLQECVGYCAFDGKIVFMSNHYAHTVSAYYCSGFKDGLMVAVDGAGDDSFVYSIDGGKWTKQQELLRSESFGALYELVTLFLGYGNFDEYKVMGLALYGDARRYRDLIRRKYAISQRLA